MTEWHDQVTIIVTAFERHCCIERFLSTVQEFLPTVRVLVSDASEVSPLEDGARPFPNVLWRHLPREMGHTVGAGRNFLVDQVETEFFFLADDDHMITPGTDIGRMHEFLSRTGYDLVGGSQSEGDYGTSIFELKGKVLYQHFYRFHEQLEERVVSCDRVSNTFLARTASVARIRWEARVFANEHAEFFWRASQGGLKIAQMGGAWVGHDRKCEEAQGLSILAAVGGHRDSKYHRKMVGSDNVWGKPGKQARQAYQDYCLSKNGLDKVVDKNNPLDRVKLKEILG